MKVSLVSTVVLLNAGELARGIPVLILSVVYTVWWLTHR